MGTFIEMQIHALKLEAESLQSQASPHEDDEEFGSSLMTWTTWTAADEAGFKRAHVSLSELINARGESL